jgi:hypothetical protein
MTDHRGRQLLRCRQKKCRNCTAHFVPFAHKCPLPETPDMSIEQSNSRLFAKPLSTLDQTDQRLDTDPENYKAPPFHRGRQSRNYAVLIHDIRRPVFHEARRLSEEELRSSQQR